MDTCPRCSASVLRGIIVDTGHPVAEVGKTRTGDQIDLTRTNHRDAHGDPGIMATADKVVDDIAREVYRPGKLAHGWQQPQSEWRRPAQRGEVVPASSAKPHRWPTEEGHCLIAP